MDGGEDRGAASLEDDPLLDEGEAAAEEALLAEVEAAAPPPFFHRAERQGRQAGAGGVGADGGPALRRRPRVMPNLSSGYAMGMVARSVDGDMAWEDLEPEPGSAAATAAAAADERLFVWSTLRLCIVAPLSYCSDGSAEALRSRLRHRVRFTVKPLHSSLTSLLFTASLTRHPGSPPLPACAHVPFKCSSFFVFLCVFFSFLGIATLHLPPPIFKLGLLCLMRSLLAPPFFEASSCIFYLGRTGEVL